MSQRKSVRERFNEAWTPEPFSGCWLWTKSTSHGYGQAYLGGRSIGAHRASWELNRGPIPDGMYVCHKCDIRACVNPDHLFIGTQSENVLDCVAKGRWVVPKGEAHFSAKLSESDVRLIRLSPERDCDIAKRFGVKTNTINQIRNRVRWKHVPNENALEVTQ